MTGGGPALPVPLHGHRLLFVGGLHHSGTTLVTRALRQHPDVSGFYRTGVPRDEGQHLQTVLPTAADLGGPGRFGMDPGGALDENSPLACGSTAQALTQSWRRHWDLGRPVLLEKSPPNLVRTRLLQQLFPGSSFVLVTRHPVAVAYATRGMGRRPLRDLLEHWSVCHDRALDDVPHLERVVVLRFEDLVRSPDAALAALFAALDLRPAGNVLHVDGDANRRHLDRWSRLRRNPLTRPLARRLCREFDGKAALLGYDMVRPRRLHGAAPLLSVD